MIDNQFIEVHVAPDFDKDAKKILEAKQHSSDYLTPTDWYVTRKSERDVAIP